MKKFKYVIISILILNLSSHQINTELIAFTDFEAIKQKSLFRIIFLPSLLAIVSYANKNRCIETIQDHPLTSCLLFYAIGNYFVDSYYQYQKINFILNILKSSKKINGYLLCAITLENNRRLFKNSSQAHEIIAEKIYEYSGFYPTEIEKIMAEVNKMALQYLNKCDAIHCNFQLTDLESMLLKENFTLDEILPLFESDHEIYAELLTLRNNEDTDVDKILQKIGLRIKHEIQLLLEKNFQDRNKLKKP